MPLLDIDPLSGAIETMDYDPVTKALTILRTENVDAVLDANTESYNDGGQAWRGADNDFWHVGRIPMTLLFAWLQEFNKDKPEADKHRDPFDDKNPEWERFLYGRLNSNEFRKLKTAPVNV